MNIDNDLRQLERLRQQGILTQAEYEQECERLRQESTAQPGNANSSKQPLPATSEYEQTGYSAKDDAQQNGTYAMMLHLILFVPYVGWLISLIMWGARRSKSPLIDAHGKGVLNMLLSTLIYCLIFGLAVFLIASLFVQSAPVQPRPVKFSDSFVISILIGFLLLVIYGTLCFIFLIVSAVNANKGKAPSYPIAFRFFDTKLPEEVRTVDQHFGNL